MRAEEIMTRDVRTIPVDASVADAVDALESAHVRHLPVVDDAGVLVGMISDRDLGPLMKTFILDEAVERMPNPPERRRLSEVMSAAPFAVDEDADLAEVIDTLVEERVGALPVVDDGQRVIGIISYVDVLVALRPTEPEAEEGEDISESPRRRSSTPRTPAG